MATSCKRLGLEMLNWHSSGGDPVYAAGSNLYAGHRVQRDIARRAATQLESYIPDARARRHGWTPKEARILAKMVRQLRSGRCG
jgi:sirohydrochlorin ferrochelatase